MTTNTQFDAAKFFLVSKNLLHDCIVEHVHDGVVIKPTYGLGRGVSEKLESLANSTIHVPTKRATKKNPKTLPVYWFAN